MRLTLNEHLDSAKDLKEAIRLIRSVYKRSCGKFPKSSGVNKILCTFLSKDVLSVKNLLDMDYHNGITDAQFKELGHIYYGEDK